MPYKHLTLTDLEDQAPGFGVDGMEARIARDALGAQNIGLTSYRVKPGQRVGFGHSHDTVEEIYAITAGTGRFKLDDEIIDVAAGDVVFCPPEVVREWEAGDDGLDVLAFGGHADGDGNMEPGWWTK